VSNLLVAIPLLIEWVLVVTITTPFALVNSRYVYSHPRFGIAMWFSAFASSVFALFAALGLAVWSIFDTYATLQTVRGVEDFWPSVATSFAPWLLLAFGGISLALITQRLEPLGSLDATATTSINGGSTLRMHRGVRVVVVELPVVLAFSLGRSITSTDAQIVITSQTIAQLTEAELDAVLDHEFYHLKARHQLCNWLVRLLSLLTSRLLTTRLMTRETELLFELAADRFAATQTGVEITNNTLKKLLANQNTRQAKIRLTYCE
jgi:Zn-dependent protease with chaperone function